jgi:hypothetical protein
MREVAARLIAEEATKNKASGSNPPDAFHVCEKLRPHLATLMGKAGFRAVLARALVVASADVPWLKEVQVNADGAMEGWDKPAARVAAKELTESGVLLVAQLLGLLAAFIGGNLTLGLVRDVWPELALEDLKNTQGDPS